MKPKLTQEYLHECFRYDPETGELFWKNRLRIHFDSDHGYRLFKARYANKKAGKIESRDTARTKYLRVGLGKKLYLAHRIVWFMLSGKWPNQIDHIDGNGLNNRLDNLRDVTHKENSRNKPIRKDNKAGIIGVYWDICRNCWVAHIRHNKKTVYLYSGSKFFEACCRRKSAENKYGYHENHGREE